MEATSPPPSFPVLPKGDVAVAAAPGLAFFGGANTHRRMRPSPPESPIPPKAFQAALLRWYGKHARRLPWRQSPSLYRTVVSELMLQQTRVATVLPYFERWQARFPDFEALAAAPSEAVLRAWEGLGYYSRARNLHRLAQALVAMPEPPRAARSWLELPGVGPYTAAAIASIAFGEPAACVDGNVVRILARLTADGARYRDGAAAAKSYAPLAARLIPARRPGDHNQAMMELGATVCTRRSPRCGECPVRRFCAGRGNPEAYPRLAPKTIETREVLRAWCEDDGALLLHRAGPTSARLAGLHELPTAGQVGLADAAMAAGRLLATKTRTITRFRIAERIVAVAPPPRAAGAARHSREPNSGALVWIAFSELPAITLSGPHRRWIGELLAGRGADSRR